MDPLKFSNLLNEILRTSGSQRNDLESLLFKFALSEFSQYLINCFQVLQANSNKDIKILTLLQLRKVLQKKLEENILNSTTINEIKNHIFILLQLEQFQQVRNFMIEILSDLCGNLMKNGFASEFLQEIWNLAINFGKDGLLCATKLFAKLFEISIENCIPHLDKIIQLIEQDFLSLDINLQLAGIDAIAKFLGYGEYRYCVRFEIYSEKMIELMKNFLIYNGKEGEEILILMSEISESEPKFFRGSFSLLLSKIVEIHNYKMSVEMIITIIERIPKSINFTQNMLESLFQIILYHMTSIKDSIDHEWEYPEDEYKEENSEIELISFGRDGFDRVISSIGISITLPVFSKLLLNILNLTDWRYQNAGIMIISQLGEYVEDMNEIKEIVKLVLNFFHSPNSMIRYAVCHCLGQLSLDLQPEFQTELQELLIRLLCQAIKDQIPKVAGHAVAAFGNFIEGMIKKDIEKYLQIIMTEHFSLINNSSIFVKSETILTIGKIAQISRESFTPYLNQCINTFFQIIVHYNTEKYRSFRGKAICSITLIGAAVGNEQLQPYLDQIIQLLSNNPSYFEYEDLIISWKRVLLASENTLNKKIELFFPILFKEISNFLNQNTNLQENIDLQTNSMQLIQLILEQYPLENLPYVENLTEFLIDQYTSEKDYSIKSIASKCLPYLVKILKFKQENNSYLKLAKGFFDILLKGLIDKNENLIKNGEIESLKNILLAVNQSFLNEGEINLLSNTLIKILIETIERIELREKKKIEDDIDEDEKILLDDDLVLDNKYIINIGELIGKIMQTHKSLSNKLIIYILEKIIPNYISLSSNDYLHRFGLFFIDDLLENINTNIFKNFHSYIYNFLISFINDKSFDIKQSCFFGLGHFVENIQIDDQIIEEVKNKCINALKIKKKNGESNRNYGFFKDNVNSTLGKLLRYNSNKINQKLNVIYIWLDNLPLKFDLKESLIQNQFLFNVLVNNPNEILNDSSENLEKVFKIIAEIYETKFSNPEINKNILIFVNGIKNLKNYDFEKFSIRFKEMHESLLKRLNKCINDLEFLK